MKVKFKDRNFNVKIVYKMIILLYLYIHNAIYGNNKFQFSSLNDLWSKKGNFKIPTFFK